MPYDDVCTAPEKDEEKEASTVEKQRRPRGGVLYCMDSASSSGAVSRGEQRTTPHLHLRRRLADARIVKTSPHARTSVSVSADESPTLYSSLTHIFRCRLSTALPLGTLCCK